MRACTRLDPARSTSAASTPPRPPRETTAAAARRGPVIAPFGMQALTHSPTHPLTSLELDPEHDQRHDFEAIAIEEVALERHWHRIG